MKIIHIIDDLSMGGGQNLLIGLAGIQKERGNDVTVLQLKKVPDLTITRKLENNEVKVVWLTETGSLYNPFLIFSIIPWIRNADIVHVHLFPALYWTGFAKMICLSKVPLIFTEHSTKNKRRMHPILRRIDNLVYKFFYKQIVACSDKALEAYVAVYPDIKHVCSINNGVDIKKYWESKPYTKAELLNVTDESFIITMVARFMFMKRQDTIVQAIGKLPENIHACFVGSEPTDVGLVKVKKMAEELGVSDRVHFLYLRSDVDRILKTSDVVIMSSEYEGLSLSSLEGMAAGKPFVATDVDGLREIVDGAGELFELYNSEQLANIISRLESNKQYYDELVESCRKRAAEYDINTMVDKYMDVYSRCLK